METNSGRVMKDRNCLNYSVTRVNIRAFKLSPDIEIFVLYSDFVRICAQCAQQPREGDMW